MPGCLFTGLRWLAALIMVVTFSSGSVRADQWTAYRLGEVTFEAPADWKVARREKDRALILQSPTGDLELRVEWWLQDEPILGYADIKSHKRITVAGKPATHVHSVFPSMQVLKAVLDEKRRDGRKLLLVLESTGPALAVISPLFDSLLARVAFGKASAALKPAEPKPAATQAPLPPQMRAVATRIAEDCEAVAPATWNHPTLAVLGKRKQARLAWVMLCRGRSYPVFGVDFDYDPQGRTSDFFSPLYDEMLRANRDAPFSFAALRDKLIIDVARPGRDEVSVDFREVPDLPRAGDRGSAAPAAPAATAELPAPEEDDVRVWLGPVSLEPPLEWQVRPDASGRLLALVRPDAGAEILVILWPEERPMPSDGVERIEHVVIAGAPAMRLRERAGPITIEHVFFDEPFADGSRLTVAYRATGEPIADGAPLFELVLASLDRKRPAPGGPTRWMSGPRATDPFADLDMSVIER